LSDDADPSLSFYLSTEGGAATCDGGASQTLNIGEKFTSTIAVANLAPGQYCIGLQANSLADPNSFLTFNTPVSAAPSRRIALEQGGTDQSEVPFGFTVVPSLVRM
jgi:hypothetical protein